MNRPIYRSLSHLRNLSQCGDEFFWASVLVFRQPGFLPWAIKRADYRLARDPYGEFHLCMQLVGWSELDQVWIIRLLKPEPLSLTALIELPVLEGISLILQGVLPEIQQSLQLARGFAGQNKEDPPPTGTNSDNVNRSPSVLL